MNRRNFLKFVLDGIVATGVVAVTGLPEQEPQDAEIVEEVIEEVEYEFDPSVDEGVTWTYSNSGNHIGTPMEVAVWKGTTWEATMGNKL